jgi:hypothetical protein
MPAKMIRPLGTFFITTPNLNAQLTRVVIRAPRAIRNSQALSRLLQQRSCQRILLTYFNTYQWISTPSIYCI